MADSAIEQFLADLVRFPFTPIHCSRDEDKVITDFNDIVYQTDVADARRLASFLVDAAGEHSGERMEDWLLLVSKCLAKASTDSQGP